jgi:hypothetical protein
MVTVDDECVGVFTQRADHLTAGRPPTSIRSNRKCRSPREKQRHMPPTVGRSSGKRGSVLPSLEVRAKHKVVSLFRVGFKALMRASGLAIWQTRAKPPEVLTAAYGLRPGPPAGRACWVACGCCAAGSSPSTCGKRRGEPGGEDHVDCGGVDWALWSVRHSSGYRAAAAGRGFLRVSGRGFHDQRCGGDA